MTGLRYSPLHVTEFCGEMQGKFKVGLARLIIFNNYLPKWRWLAVDIYRAAKRRGKYPTLATDTEVNSCFSIY